MRKKKLEELAALAAKREPQNLGYRPSRPFDFFLWLDHKNLDAYVSKLAEQIDASAVARRKRDKSTQAKFIFSIKLIILNLLAAHSSPLRTLQAIPRGSGQFSAKTRYDHQLLAHRPFTEAYDGLTALKLIREEQQGYYNKDTKKGHLTRIEATRSLKKKLDMLFPQEVIFFSRHLDEEIIRLKNSTEKKLIDYKDNNYTKSSRIKLRTINACLNRHWYDLRLTNTEFNSLYAQMTARHKKEAKKPASIQFHQRGLYRIYNNGDMPEGKEFAHGGRFYGGWWEGIPSEYRNKITINGKATVEIDYTAYHPHMLYAIEGQRMKGDAYLPKGLVRE